MSYFIIRNLKLLETFSIRNYVYSDVEKNTEKTWRNFDLATDALIEKYQYSKKEAKTKSGTVLQDIFKSDIIFLIKNY